MVRIAICDDMSHELQNLVALTEQYVSRNGVDAEVIGFNHPDALLTAMEAERFHVYVLDIVMPMVSGLELGKAIRRIDREAQIIYASTEPQFALQAYAALTTSAVSCGSPLRTHISATSVSGVAIQSGGGVSVRMPVDVCNASAMASYVMWASGFRATPTRVS